VKWTVVVSVWIFLLLFLWGTAHFLLEIQGRDDVPQAVADELYHPVLAFVGLVGLAHLAAGFVSGVMAGGLARWAFPGRRVLGPVVCLAAVYFYVFGRDLVAHPVFYEPHLYQTGALPRACMTLMTDHLSPRALDLFALCVAAGLLFLGVVSRRRLWRSSRRVGLLGAGLVGLSCLGFAGVLLVCAPGPLALIAGSEIAGSEIAGGMAEEAANKAVSGPSADVRGDPKPINLVLLGMDSLRSDRLGAAGCPRDVLPNLDAVARTGAVFTQVFVPLARTAPSLVSLFTGTDPHTHGIRHMFPPRGQRTVRVPTLPRVLANHGYRSEVVTDYAGDMFNQIDLGFDAVLGPPACNLLMVVEYEILRRTPAFLPFFNHPTGHRLFRVLQSLPANADPDWVAGRVVDRLDALEALEARQQPFCLTGYFTGPHTPYAAPFPGYRLFTNPSYHGPNKYAYFVRSLDLLARLEDALPEQEVEQIRALYDGACRMTDEAVGRVIREIRRRGLWQNTLIVLFADHGESLYEPRNTSDHGKWFRGDEANRIPLILAGGPAEKLGGVVVDDLVRTIDVLPTILTLLNLDVPPTVEGVDLGPRMRGEPTEPLTVFAETGVWLDAPTTFHDDPEALIYPSIDKLLLPDPDGIMVLRDTFHDVVEEAKHRCLRTDQWKLVYVPTRTGVRYHLYDVKNDPANLEDLAGTHPWRVLELAHRLHHWMLRDPGKRLDARGHLVPRYRYFE
jgi:arylsulfatase A-like enzyme